MPHAVWPPTRRAVAGRGILHGAALQSWIAVQPWVTLQPWGRAAGSRRILRAPATQTAGCRLALLQGHESALQASAVTRLSLAPRIVARHARRGACDKDSDGGHPDRAHVRYPFYPFFYFGSHLQAPIPLAIRRRSRPPERQSRGQCTSRGQSNAVKAGLRVGSSLNPAHLCLTAFAHQIRNRPSPARCRYRPEACS